MHSPLPVLHQDMPAVAQMRLFSLALARQERFGVCRGSVRGIAALLAVKIHRRVARIIVGALRLRAILRLQALDRGPGPDQCAIHREMVGAGISLDHRLGDDAVEKLPHQIMLLEALPIHAERLRRPDRIVGEVHKPAVQQVELNRLHQLNLASDRVQRLKEQSFQQPLRRDARPSDLAVGGLEIPVHRTQDRIGPALDRSQRMIPTEARPPH